MPAISAIAPHVDISGTAGAAETGTKLTTVLASGTAAPGPTITFIPPVLGSGP